jgi:hypothetical protein
MKKTTLDDKISIVGFIAKKGQFGGKHNAMRRIRQYVREIQSIRRNHWFYRLENFLTR